MTPKNKKLNAQMEHKESLLCSEEAQLLRERGYFRGAVSRKYYALYHMEKAALFTIELQPKSHSGAHDLFSLHFIKTSIFPKHFGAVISRLQKHRESSDYDSFFEINEDDVSRDFEDAEEILSAIEQYLKKEGYLEDD